MGRQAAKLRSKLAIEDPRTSELVVHHVRQWLHDRACRRFASLKIHQGIEESTFEGGDYCWDQEIQFQLSATESVYVERQIPQLEDILKGVDKPWDKHMNKRWGIA